MSDLAKTIFWDYPMTDRKMKRLLNHGTEWEKRWVASRLLERAPFEKIWHFLTLAQVRQLYPRLWVRPQIKKIWDKALLVWNNEKNTDQNKAGS